MQTKLTGLPLLEALEDEGHCAHVRDIELLEDARSLLVILTGRSTNESESRQVDHGVDDGLAETVVVVFLDRSCVENGKITRLKCVGSVSGATENSPEKSSPPE